jgi:hypothetical protein
MSNSILIKVARLDELSYDIKLQIDEDVQIWQLMTARSAIDNAIEERSRTVYKMTNKKFLTEIIETSEKEYKELRGL